MVYPPWKYDLCVPNFANKENMSWHCCRPKSKCLTNEAHMASETFVGLTVEERIYKCCTLMDPLFRHFLKFSHNLPLYAKTIYFNAGKTELDLLDQSNNTDAIHVKMC